MIYFTAEEIYLSFFYSAIYGVGFALLLVCFDMFFTISESLSEYYKSVLSYECITKINRPYLRKSVFRKAGRVRISLSILLFFVGYLLLSYFALDGISRFYTFVVALISTFALKVTLGKLIAILMLNLIHIIFYPLILLLRIIMHPILKMRNFS